MEISQPAFLFYIHLTYLPIFHSPILTLWYVTFLDKMCSLKKSFHNYCKYEIKNILAQLWPRTDVYARKPLAQKYMNVVPRGPDGLFITFQWLIAMLSHTPTFKILDIVWKFLCSFVGLYCAIHFISKFEETRLQRFSIS